MAEIRPFKGVLYNLPGLAHTTGEDLLAPPYDIITPACQDELYRRSPFNIVRVDFGKENPDDDGDDNKYTRAEASLLQWLDDKTLITSPRPCYYSYEIGYSLRGISLTLTGFLGLVKLEPLGRGNIHPHEYTHSKPKKDRLDLMRICKANISPIFSLYNSPEKKTSSLLAGINRSEPYIEARDQDGSLHRLREICDPEAIRVITEELRDKAIFIADGHHRYETALEYQKAMRLKEGSSAGPWPYDYVLMFLANMSEEGLTILPTHRLVSALPPDALDVLATEFEIRKMHDISGIPEGIAGKRDVYGLYTGGDAWYLLSYKGEGIHGVPSALKDLDVTILHDLIFKQLLDIETVSYEMDVQKCIDAVRTGQYGAAFFLNSTQVSDVERVALASLRMPPKSTYFYPKLMTGMVLHIFNKSF